MLIRTVEQHYHNIYCIYIASIVTRPKFNLARGVWTLVVRVITFTAIWSSPTCPRPNNIAETNQWDPKTKSVTLFSSAKSPRSRCLSHGQGGTWTGFLQCSSPRDTRSVPTPRLLSLWRIQQELNNSESDTLRRFSGSVVSFFIVGSHQPPLDFSTIWCK